MKKRNFKKLLKRTNSSTNLYAQAMAYAEVDEQLFEGIKRGWPSECVEILRRVHYLLYPAYIQRLQMLRRYGIKEK